MLSNVRLRGLQRVTFENNYLMEKWVDLVALSAPSATLSQNSWQKQFTRIKDCLGRLVSQSIMRKGRVGVQGGFAHTAHREAGRMLEPGPWYNLQRPVLHDLPMPCKPHIQNSMSRSRRWSSQ